MITPCVEWETWDVAARDGERLVVHTWAPPGGSDCAVVPLHGGASHAGWFEPLGRALARRGIATHAPDRRGSGRLRGLPLPSDPEVWIDDLLRVLAAVRGRSGYVCLVPWCFGVKLGVPAVGDGDAVDQLLLLAPAFGFAADVADRAAARLSLTDATPLPAGDDRFVESEAGRAFLAADALRWTALPPAFRALSARLNAMMLAQLSRVSAPLTAIFPTRDRVTDGKAGRRLMAELGHPSRSIDGSHCFFLEQPDAAADLLRDLLL